MPIVRRRLLAGMAATVIAAGAAPSVALAAPAAPAVVPGAQPPGPVHLHGGHVHRRHLVPARLSGGSRDYRVAVRGPRHIRFFYRHGQAPASGWRRWKIRAGRTGEYRTVYSGHRPGSAAWTRYRAVTRARRCH